MDPRPYNKENLRKAINNLSEIGRRELIARFEIEDMYEDGDGLENFIDEDYWWMDDPSILSNRSKIGEHFGDVWDWLDEYGNMSDQEWIKLLGPDAPSVKPPEPPPTCAGCDSEDIEFYHDYYGGFCGGDCFDGYLEENKLENYSITQNAESYADFFTQMEELLESTTIAGGWTLDATTDQEDPDAVTMVVKFKPADPSTFFDIIE
jgi:hypothetical protein